MGVEHIEFQPLKLIQQIVKTHELAAMNKQIRLVCHADLNIPDVLWGDPLRLRQVLDNLLSNAIKFTEQGEVQLLVDVKQRSHEKTMLTFSVRDTGIGIPSHQISQLFDALRNLTSPMREGSGQWIRINDLQRIAGVNGRQYHGGQH